MNPFPSNINPYLGEGAGPGSTSFDPTAMQTLQQSVSDVYGLGTVTSLHTGNPHNNSLGMQPQGMFPGLVAPQVKQWSGTMAWLGTDTTRNERKEVRAQVTATASNGDPLASTWPGVLLLAPAGPAVSMDKLHEWIGKTDPVVMHIRPTSEMDLNSYGQLVKLLRYKNCYAIAGWEIPGKGHSMNLLIALYTKGLICAAFPTTGIPEIPKSRSTHLGPAVHIVGGDGSGMNNGASLETVGGRDERISREWTGTLTWQAVDTNLNERKEVCAQVTVATSKGDLLASTWPKVLSLAPAGPAVSTAELDDWMKKYGPVVIDIQATPGTDGHNCGQLVKLLSDKSCYAVGGWRIPGKDRSTMNLLIAPSSQGLIGAVFPTTGMPEIPKPRLPQLDPMVYQTIFNLLSPEIRNLPEPQLSQAINQIFISQRHRFNTVQDDA